jgi:hypothetical protein
VRRARRARYTSTLHPQAEIAMRTVIGVIGKASLLLERIGGRHARGVRHACSTAKSARVRLAAVFALALVACTASPPERPPAAAAPGAAPVAREPMPTPPLAAAPDTLAFVASEVPPGTLYVCVSNAEGRRQQLAIAFDPNVRKLCERHPEMGPCQYERNACRRAGGRVFTAAGLEVTAATEAEYDRKVMRVRFRAD